MGINWENFAQITTRQKLYGQIRKAFTADTYGKTWTVEDVISSDDPRAYEIRKMLVGDMPDGSKRPDLAPVISIRLRVLARQACCRDKDGNRIWHKKVAFEQHGESTDLLPEYTEAPKAGDVVEWKGPAKTHNPETGKPVDGRMIKAWARQGIRPEDYYEYVVDSDGCITVPWLTALRMLLGKGKNTTKPRFRKVDKSDKEKRKIVNHWFQEEFKKPRKTHSDKGAIRAAPASDEATA